MNNIFIYISVFLYLFILPELSGAADSTTVESKKIANMVYVKAGEFTMGSVRGDDDERPVHKVYLDGYWIGKYEATNGEYRKFMRDTGNKEPRVWDNPDINPTDNHPVVGVTWEDAMNFTKWRSGKTGISYRLPTEAEWEKAARGTDARKFPWGNSHPGKTMANFVIDEDGYRFLAPVGSFKKGVSPYGVFDMAGNVWEWCLDWYSESYYKGKSVKNPRGPEKGGFHVVRGGSWVDTPYYIRATMRNSSHSSTYRYGLIGFRMAADMR